MASKREQDPVEVEVEPAEQDLSRETTWLTPEEVGPEMVQLPYIYLMQGRSELDKQYPGHEGEYYLSGLGVFPELRVVPVQAGKRQEYILRGGNENLEDVFRLMVVEVDHLIPAVMTFKGTSKQAFRQLMTALKWGDRTFGSVVVKFGSVMQSGEKGRTWYVPTIEVQPDTLGADECQHLVAHVMGGTAAEIQAGEVTPEGTDAEGMPF